MQVRILDRRLCELRLRHRLSPSVPENSPEGSVQFFKIDAYDEQFLTSSVVACGMEYSASGYRKHVGAESFRPLIGGEAGSGRLVYTW